MRDRNWGVTGAGLLSPDFTEQRKEIITHLVQGDGSLFLDNIPNGTRFDASALASAMTNPRYKGRLLGTNKQIEASTRTMVVANGNGLNLAGDLASRFLLSRLDTGLERSEDRSVTNFKISDLRRWVVKNRQRLVAAVHTVVRAYLEESASVGKTPPHVADRRQVTGTRFGGSCDVLRDAFLWAFPDLPDPFLSFQASALNSSTKANSALVLGTLDAVMTEVAGFKSAPAWTKIIGLPNSAERLRWEAKFKARWNRMTPDQREYRWQTTTSRGLKPPRGPNFANSCSRGSDVGMSAQGVLGSRAPKSSPQCRCIPTGAPSSKVRCRASR